AFNSIGWQPQNVLFNGLDALLGDTTLGDAFGADVGSGATASLTNTVVDASGKVTVEAQTQTHIDADVGNTSTANVTNGQPGTRGLAMGAVLALNKVSSAADASISYAALPTIGSGVQAGTGISVKAGDSTSIDATITLVTNVTLSIASGPGSVSG